MAIKESKKGLFDDVKPEKLEAPEVVKEEKESINIKISKETRKRLKMYCAMNGLIMGDLVARLINDFLEEVEK